MANETVNTLFTAVANVTGRSQTSLSADMRLIKDLQLQSIDVIDLLYEIEKLLLISINLGSVFSSLHPQSSSGQQFDLSLEELARYIDDLTKQKKSP